MKHIAHYFRIVIILFLISCGPGEPEKPDHSLIGEFVKSNGEITYAALLSFPETSDVFTEVAGDGAWKTYHPSSVSKEFTDSEKNQIIEYVQEFVDGMTETERGIFLDRLRCWIAGYHNFNLMEIYASRELTFAVIAGHPDTKFLFRPIASTRGVDIESVDPMFFGETMTSAEGTEMLYNVLAEISSWDKRDQLIYYRDMYKKLSESTVKTRQD